jgi:hypothetical protein
MKPVISNGVAAGIGSCARRSVTEQSAAIPSAAIHIVRDRNRAIPRVNIVLISS